MQCASVNETEMRAAMVYYQEMLGPFKESFENFYGYVYPVLCVVGVLANIAIIVVLLRPAMRKNPFNMFLVAIAVCDMMLMATYLAQKQVERCHPLYMNYAFVVFQLFYAIMSVFIHSVSLWLTVNMAVLRYLVLKRGSSARTKIPPCNGYGAAAIGIVLAIIVAFLGSLTNMLRYKIEYGGVQPVHESCLADPRYNYEPDAQTEVYAFKPPTWWGCGWERFNFWIAAVLLKVVPCILLTVFMALLVRMLMEARERRARLCGAASASAGSSQAERTTAMLTIIVAVFLVTELPQGLFGLLVGINIKFYGAIVHFGPFLDMLSLINSSVNFLLCALMSNVFRREFLLTFSACCPQTSENISGAKSQITVSRTNVQSTSKIVSFINSRSKAKNSKHRSNGCKNGFQPLPSSCPDEIKATAICNGGDHVVLQKERGSSETASLKDGSGSSSEE